MLQHCSLSYIHWLQIGESGYASVHCYAGVNDGMNEMFIFVWERIWLWAALADNLQHHQVHSWHCAMMENIQLYGSIFLWSKSFHPVA